MGLRKKRKRTQDASATLAVTTTSATNVTSTAPCDVAPTCATERRFTAKPLQGKRLAVSTRQQQHHQQPSHKHDQQASSTDDDCLGKRFAVNTLQQPHHQQPSHKNDQQASSTDEDCLSSFACIRDLCVTAGAEYSAQVHKKVDAVIASPEAIEPPATQRVRKAWKLGIPILTVKWLQDCVTRQQYIPMDLYYFPNQKHDQLQQQEQQRKRPYREKSVKAEGAPQNAKRPKSELDHQAVDDVASDQSRIIDLGCCCVCHDLVEPGTVTDCEWCRDCNINRLYRRRLNDFDLTRPAQLIDPDDHPV